MNYLIGLFESVRDFIATGGDVLYFVAAALFLMWVLMIERYWYLTSVFPKVKKKHHRELGCPSRYHIMVCA